MNAIELTTILLVLASVFSMFNMRVLKLPGTIGLMTMALLLSLVVLGIGTLFPSVHDLAIHVTEGFDFGEVLLNVMLPFLLFAGAITVDVNKLFEEKWPILLLASFGVVVSTFLVGTGAYLLTQIEVLGLADMEIEYIHCLLFGSLIAPTDPIAVLAIVKETGLSKNLETKIAGESLFNDGIGVVVFLTLLKIEATGVESASVESVSILFGQEVFGGAMLGLIMGYLGLKLLDWIDNEHVQIEALVTLSGVLLAAVTATHLHLSGPIAVVILGLFLGKEGRVGDQANFMGQYVYKFWHLIDETLNAILFILVGLEIIVISEYFEFHYITAVLVTILIAVLARFIGVAIPISVLAMFRSFEKRTIPILTWGGLKGGLSIALALSLPEFPGKHFLLILTYGVVIFTILVQGLTIEKLVPGSSK